MKFDDKLLKAMLDLGINQAKVVSLTGKSKSSVSMYLSGKSTPPEKVQADIAVSLGLDEDYFEQEDPAINLVKRSGAIPEIRPKDAAKLMRMNHTTLEKGLQQGVFPWGYAIKTSNNHYRYFINAARFAEIEGVRVPLEMEA